MNKIKLIITSLPATEAANFAEQLITLKIAACVNLLNSTSLYYWENKLVNESESILLIKTTLEKVSELKNFFKDQHPYQVPELLELEAESLNSSYSNWLKDYLK